MHMHVLEWIFFTINGIGIAIIVCGVILVTFEFLFSGLFFLKHKQITDKNQLRLHLGSYILLGLEFLIAADIIETVLHPSTERLIILGSIVFIRTIISYFLDRELKTLAQKD